MPTNPLVVNLFLLSSLPQFQSQKLRPQLTEQQMLVVYIVYSYLALSGVLGLAVNLCFGSWSNRQTVTANLWMLPEKHDRNMTKQATVSHTTFLQTIPSIWVK